MSALDDLAAELDERLAGSDAALAARYPGAGSGRQPVHTVYVPADRFDTGFVPEWGRQAREALDAHGGTSAELATLLGLDEQLVREVRERVEHKLDVEPVEDVRIDFEDGYGDRPDAEEDADATQAAHALATAVSATAAPPLTGIRFKSLEAATRRRGLRTLNRFLDVLTSSGDLPPGFVLTLPKVTSVEQVEAMVLVCERMEQAYGLPERRLGFELQIETPQAILGADGTALVARMIHVAGGRCSGLHYGTYDYSAACGVSAEYQSMEHPAADHAKAVMQVAAAGTGVRLSDGSTNVLPVGDRDAVRAAWRLHARLVRRSLERGFAQGWDLHPAQLPSRYLATYAFYREGLPETARRMRAYAGTETAGVLDEPATATAMRGYLNAGIACGALDADEVAKLTGLETWSPDPGLDLFNTAPEAELRRRLLACCDIDSWADDVLHARPYRDRDTLLAAADRGARRWSRSEVEHALAAHPRIGDRATGDGTQAQWSRTEQSGVARDTATADALVKANAEYEARFDRVFLICATGLDAQQILDALQERLRNDAEAEARVTADELRKIALLRLGKVLDDEFATDERGG